MSTAREICRAQGQGDQAVADGQWWPVLDEIAAERRRQVREEKFTIEHDDKMGANGCLAQAAASYAWSSLKAVSTQWILRHLWPKGWGEYWFKPGEARRDLIKAGALLVAEIERRDRQAAREAERS